MATRKKIGRPANKRAATKHFAGNKVGPHRQIAKNCEGPFLKDAPECTLDQTVKEGNARHIAAANKAFNNLKSQVDSMLAAAGIKVFTVKEGEPLPDELKEIVDSGVRAALVAATGDKLNSSEALSAFMGWLTTRKMPVILSEKHNAAVVAELVSIFRAAQGLPLVRPDWDKRVKPMGDLAVHLTNDPALNPTQVAPPPPSFDEAYQQMLHLFRGFSTQRQNHLLARLLEELKETRLAEFHVLTTKIEQDSNRHTQLADATKELDQVLSGNFTIVHV